MSLIPTRQAPARAPHAQTLLDIATLQRASALVAHYREPHRSIHLTVEDRQLVLAAIGERLDALAATIDEETWNSLPKLAWIRDHLHEPIGNHSWADALADDGWGYEVGDALAGDHLPWMRFDSCDGCLVEPTIPELLLALHIHEIVT